MNVFPEHSKLNTKKENYEIVHHIILESQHGVGFLSSEFLRL